MLGTAGYMAPEIHLKYQYQAQVADLFALGVTFFMLYAGTKPFAQATYDDPLFKLIVSHKTHLFWQAHEADKPTGFFTDSFKDLITAMLSHQPFARPTIADLVGHPWFQNRNFATRDQVRAEL